jgi:hypothetical protein
MSAPQSITPQLMIGNRADRPALGKTGLQFFAKDENALYIHNGTQWARVLTNITTLVEASEPQEQRVFIQAAQPDVEGSFLWLQTTAAGELVTAWVNT